MTTLIVEYSGGRIVGRCDARCYDAEHEDCTCICGGKNHGKGKEQALENTANDALDMIKNWQTAKELGVIDVTAEPNHIWNPLAELLTLSYDEPEPDIDPRGPRLFNTWADVMPGEAL